MKTTKAVFGILPITLGLAGLTMPHPGLVATAISILIGSTIAGTGQTSKLAESPALKSSTNTQLNIPAPIGFLEGSRLSEVLTKRGLVGSPPSVKLLGFYCPADVLAGVLKNGEDAPSMPFCVAKLQKTYAAIPDAKEAFKTLVANAKKDNPIDRNNPDIEKIYQRAENAVNNTYPGMGARIKGILPIANIIDSESAFAFTALANTATSNENRPIAIAGAFLLIDTQQVQLGVCYPFTGQIDIDATKHVLLQWVSDIQKATAPKSGE